MIRRTFLATLAMLPRLRQTSANEGVPDDAAALCKSRDVLREMTAVQCSNGNWNYDPYMHGMANGMILALSLFDDTSPEYLDAPQEWLADRSVKEPCVTRQTAANILGEDK